MVVINIKKRHLFLLSALFVFLIGVGLVISGITWDNPQVWHDSSNVKIPGNMKLSGIFDNNGKIKCSEIAQDGGTDTNFCNDATEVDSGANCEWKTISVSSSYSKYFAKVSLQDALNNGFTGACKFQAPEVDGGQVFNWVGSLKIYQKNTGTDNTYLDCYVSDEIRTGNGDLWYRKPLTNVQYYSCD